jgi:hypothetical protein
LKLNITKYKRLQLVTQHYKVHTVTTCNSTLQSRKHILATFETTVYMQNKKLQQGHRQEKATLRMVENYMPSPSEV